ncbi:hypothetical protein D3P07_10220 [Paenibacillus sp. 1011MAR3C5]|nr:hypothetical protein D3P07_10220 [Paenibacillus sp. 1011MAR3C5]
MNKEDIVSEIVWLDFLNERMNMPLPKRVQARNEASVVRVFQGYGTQAYASLMRWESRFYFMRGDSSFRS